MSPTELKALVAFLQSLSGEVTVEITAQDVQAADARKQQAPASTASTHPGAALLTSQACVACHDVTGTARRVGPPLTNVRERLSATEIRQSIVDPNAVIAEGFQPGLMLTIFAEKLAPEELDQLVGYLSGEVSLAERLSHPGVHLAFLILLFNAGAYAAMRLAPPPDRATAPGDLAPKASKRRWRLIGALLAAIVLVGGIYLAVRDRSPEPPAETPARAPVEPTTLAPAPVEPPAPVIAAVEPAALLTAADGKALYMVTCPACHGPGALGIPGLGKDMTTSAFIESKSDEELVTFIKQGRAVDDPLNTTGVPMPPMGANPALSDTELLAIVQFIRSLRN
jgi:disulfide bond formation protein DsbB